MTYFYLPYTVHEQTELIENLRNVVYMTFDEKSEIERIKSILEQNRILTTSEKGFLELMIKKYGIYS